MINILTPFFALMLLGVFWNCIPGLPSGIALRKHLSFLVLNFLLPMLVFRIFYLSPLPGDFWKIPLVAAVSCLLTAAAGLGIYLGLIQLTRKQALTQPSLGSLLLGSAWGNVTYLGLPVITALYGTRLQQLPILFDLLALSPLLFTVGVFIGTRFGHTKHTIITAPSPLNSLSGLTRSLVPIMKLPPLWAGIAGVVCYNLALPISEPMLLVFGWLAKAVAPLMIFSIGLALRMPGPKNIKWALPALFLKLFISPCIAFVLCKLIHLDSELLPPAVLEAGMPTMVLGIVIAERFGLDTELLAQLIAVSTLLSFVSIPVLRLLIS